MPRRNIQGFSLILVLFLLVVVSLLVVAMARLNSGSQKAIGQEVLSVRALFAAESGAQEAAMKMFPINATPVACVSFATPRAFAVSGLNGCTANVTCQPPVTAAGRTVYTIKSEGICGSGNEKARRNLTVGLRTQ